MQDQELIASWRRGDSAAADQLVRRYFDGIFGFFSAKIGDGVDDLVQATFADALARGAAEPITSWRAFIYTVARRRLYDHLRARYAVEIDGQQTLDALPIPGSGVFSKVVRSEETELLQQALRRLPLDLQIALELTYWEGLKAPEIAEVLEIPANTVRGRLARARDLLREQMRQCSTPSS